MNQRESNFRPNLNKRSVRNSRHEAHSMLKAVLRDIRQSLSRLERQVDNVVEICPPKRNHDKAA